MAIGNLIAASLEDAGVETVEIDERTEAQIDIEAERDAIEQVDVLEAQVGVVQSLEHLITVTRGLIENQTASAESALLIQTSLEHLFGDDEFVDTHSLGFESGTSIDVYHQHAVASMEGMVKKMVENIGETIRASNAGWKVLFSANANKAAVIVERSIVLKKWFADHATEAKEFDTPWRSNGMLGTFHVNGKRPENFESAILKDSGTVVKMIEESSKAYRDSIDSVIGVLQKAKSDEELVEGIKKLKHPTASISPSLFVKDALLISSAFVLKEGKPITTAYDFGEINQSKRVVLSQNIGKTLIKALPTIAFANLAIIVGGRHSTNANTVDKVLDGIEKYARALNTSVRGGNKIEDLSGKLASAATKAVENGISKGAVNAVNSLVVDMVAAMGKTEKSTWAHGFEICRTSLTVLSGLAKKINSTEAPKEIDLGGESQSE